MNFFTSLPTKAKVIIIAFVILALSSYNLAIFKIAQDCYEGSEYKTKLSSNYKFVYGGMILNAVLVSISGLCIIVSAFLWKRI